MLSSYIYFSPFQQRVNFLASFIKRYKSPYFRRPFPSFPSFSSFSLSFLSSFPYYTCLLKAITSIPTASITLCILYKITETLNRKENGLIHKCCRKSSLENRTRTNGRFCFHASYLYKQMHLFIHLLKNEPTIYQA